MQFLLPKLFGLNKLIGVLGCGWLGLPLATSLISEGNQVHGSTTSEEKLKTLKNKGITPYLITFSEKEILGDISKFLVNVDVLIVNIPPKLRGKNKESYVKKIELLHHEVIKNAVRKIIFVSSTSVYGDIEGDVTEKTVPQPSTESGEQLLAAENIFKNDTNLDTTIIRFGGLIGPNRHPITMLSGRKELSNGNYPINLIHLNDCIRIITAVLENSWWNETLNGVFPKHPSKRKYYTNKAIELRLQIPDYKEDNALIGKKIHSKALINVKGYEFTTTL